MVLGEHHQILNRYINLLGVEKGRIGKVFYMNYTVSFVLCVDDETYDSVKNAVLHRLPVSYLSIGTKGFEFVNPISFYEQVWNKGEDFEGPDDDRAMTEVIIEDFSISFGG